MHTHSGKKILFIIFLNFFISAGFSQAIQQKTEMNAKSFHSTSNNYSISRVPAENNNVEVVKQEHANASNFHFENEKLTAEVSNRVAFNKAHQRPLSEGILKSYKVSIKACNTEESTKKTFSFLYNTSGFVKADFLSAGVVNLIVLPEYNSVDLKDKMLSKQLNFNFISETYFLK
jgi:hypothetical protein